jgi:geranylgeranyl diphosphate synthase type II
LPLVDIDRGLQRYLPKGGDTVKKAMRYSALSGGKRIRPLLVVESAHLCGGTVKEAMPAACAIEFIHTYSLIHDDLPAMDDDDVRRGKPTCHKVFGQANAILAGDGLLTLAFDVISKHIEPKKAVRLISGISEAIGADGMVGGQALDLEYQRTGRDSAISKKINLLKTAKLFEVSARAGAIVAGAGVKREAALGNFGRYFGLSFQAVDDYIDGDIKARPPGLSARMAGGTEAFKLVEKAKKELDIFGARAGKLKAMADFAVRRNI